MTRLLPLLVVLAATPPQVAFKELPGTHYGIVRLDEDGGAALPLTQGRPEPAIEGAFSWSPDGSRLVYAGRGLVGGDLYTIGADGGEATRLTSGGGNQYPAWSPDGRRIAYVHTVRVRRPNGLYRLDEDVWLVDAGGGNARRLTRDAGEKYAPAWSPDGTRILYTRAGSGTFVVDADSGRVRLHIRDGGGEWSPDGSRIAVQHGNDIAVVGADGTGLRTVARDAGGPVWSPDGSGIAFTRSHCTPGVKGLCGAHLASVYVVGADGRGERRLTGPIGGGRGATLDGFPADDSSAPAWWPDSSRLFFFAGGDHARVMNADGTCEQPFGPPDLLLADPAWRPGAKPSPPPFRCVDLRVRATPERDTVGLRGVARIDVAVENDGNEPASGVELSLRLEYGRGHVASPHHDLPPLAAGAATHLVVRVAHPKPIVFHLEANVTAREADSDPASNEALAFVGVLDCDLVGTPGPDRLVGTARRDSICGLPGADVIVGGRGHDVLEGGAGNDRIFARDGERDTIECGDGRDTVYADRVDAVARDCERVHRR